MIKISILIPSHNNEATIFEALKSAEAQDYPNKEILVIDDASTDNTAIIVKCFENARLIINQKNLGIGGNLVKLINEAKGKYLFFLCADDIITHPKVISDYVSIFDKQTDVGVIGRPYYFFMDGCPDAIGVCRDTNILTMTCCPSGVGLRKIDGIKASNKIFIEMPSIVVQYLDKWRWTMIEYDVVASRFKPGVNTGTKKEYYTESVWQNWVDLTGDKNWKDYPSFIMLKNRASFKILWREICLAVKLDKRCLIQPGFLFYALIAIIVPTTILRLLTTFYRSKIGKLNAVIIERPNDV